MKLSGAYRWRLAGVLLIVGLALALVSAARIIYLTLNHGASKTTNGTIFPLVVGVFLFVYLLFWRRKHQDLACRDDPDSGSH